MQFEQWLAQVADDNDTARAERLTALFERSRFTRQKDLAEEIDVETRTVQRWLAGDGIAKRYWAGLAAALDTTVRFLIFGEEEQEDLDESQLDRIEAKLDELLSRLPAMEVDEVLEAEADRLDAQREQNDAKSKHNPHSRKAS